MDIAVDVGQVTKEQLDFSHNYELSFIRNDTFNGLVTWFDIEFGGMPNVVKFSTGIESIFLFILICNSSWATITEVQRVGTTTI